VNLCCTRKTEPGRKFSDGKQHGAEPLACQARNSAPDLRD
jgi:hypothetical protein